MLEFPQSTKPRCVMSVGVGAIGAERVVAGVVGRAARDDGDAGVGVKQRRDVRQHLGAVPAIIVGKAHDVAGDKGHAGIPGA